MGPGLRVPAPHFLVELVRVVERDEYEDTFKAKLRKIAAAAMAAEEAKPD